MKRFSLVLCSSIALCSCAEERIVEGSHSFYREVDRLSKQEVVDNIDATIDNIDRIPTRTTFGKGNLTFTDNAQAGASVPFHVLSSNAGTATGNIGAFTDSYQLAIVPDVDGAHLAALRDIYRALIDSRYKSLLPIPEAQARWIYWTNLDGTPSGHEPPEMGATLVGHGTRHDIYVTDMDAFGKFILLTYGYVSSPSRYVTVAAQTKSATIVQRPHATEPTPASKKQGTPSVRLGSPGDRPAPAILYSKQPLLQNILPPRPSPGDNSSALPNPPTR